MKTVIRGVEVKNTLTNEKLVNQRVHKSFHHKFRTNYSCYTNQSPKYGKSIVDVLPCKQTNFEEIVKQVVYIV